MRALLTLALLVTAPAVAQTTRPAVALPKACAGAYASQVDLATPKAKLRKLGELPPARPFYTVLREIDGCPQKVAVRAAPKR